jgi:hypothetical protein
VNIEKFMVAERCSVGSQYPVGEKDHQRQQYAEERKNYPLPFAVRKVNGRIFFSFLLYHSRAKLIHTVIREPPGHKKTRLWKDG